MVVDNQFLTKNKFGKMIEEAVTKYRLSYMDAVIHVCDDNEIDLEDVGRFINPTLKEKIAAEASRLNFLPKQNTLPI